MRKVFFALAALMCAAVVIQFFLAGSGAFDSAPLDESFAPHRALGYVIVLTAVLAVVVGALVRIPRRLLGRTGLAALLTVLQPVIAGVANAVGESGGSSTTAGQLVFGLHAVNGLAIVALIGTVARQARLLQTSHTSTQVQPSAGGGLTESAATPDPAR